MTVQVGLCRTCSETTLLVFPRGCSFISRSENGKLKRHNEELHQRYTRAMTRLKDLEDQTEQHSRVQEKMKERLKMMDDHAQSQGQQVRVFSSNVCHCCYPECSNIS